MSKVNRPIEETQELACTPIMFKNDSIGELSSSLDDKPSNEFTYRITDIRLPHQQSQGIIEKQRIFQKQPKYKEFLGKFEGSIILLEGLIGSGKTKLGESLEYLYNSNDVECVFESELVDKESLKLFLSDMRKYAFWYQCLMLQNRIAIYKKAMKSIKNKKMVVIIDRSLEGDMAFELMHHDNGNINDEEHELYKHLLKSANLIEPATTIVLDCDPAVALGRIKKRNRDGESTYTVEYLSDLRDAYNRTLSETDHLQIYMDWNKDLKLTRSVTTNNTLINQGDCIQFMKAIRFAMDKKLIVVY